MAEAFAQFDELLDLLDRLDADPASDVLRQQLRDLLLANPSARSNYIKYVHLVSGLQWILDPLPIFRQSDRPVSVPALDSPSRSAVGWPRREGSATALMRPAVIWSTLACSLVFAGYWLIITWNIRDKAPADATTQTQPHVAEIVSEHNAQWIEPPSRFNDPAIAPQPRDIAKPGEPPRAGQTLSLASGQVRMKLKQGAELLIEGPAQWSIEGTNEANLTRGRLYAIVPGKAVGFTLSTPNAKIVDLGTEFAVDVRDQQTTEIAVTRGQVNAQLRSPEGSNLLGPPALVVANQTRLITTNGIAVVRQPSPALRSLMQTSGKMSPLYGSGLIAADRFNYPDGPLAGNAGGIEGGRGHRWSDGAIAGWNGWKLFTPADTGHRIVAGTVNFTTAETGLVQRMVDTPYRGSSDKPLYFAGRFRQSNSDPMSAAWLKVSSTNSSEEFQTATLGLANNRFSARLGDGLIGDFGTIELGKWHTIVGKLEFDIDHAGNERLTVWVDPIGIEQAEHVSQPLIKDLGWNALGRVDLRAWGNDNARIEIDDIVVSEQWPVGFFASGNSR